MSATSCSVSVRTRGPCCACAATHTAATTAVVRAIIPAFFIVFSNRAQTAALLHRAGRESRPRLHHLFNRPVIEVEPEVSRPDDFVALRRPERRREPCTTHNHYILANQ